MSDLPGAHRLAATVGTVRFRVAALATAAVVIVLVAAGVGLVALQQELLTENLEDGIAQQAGDVASLVAGGLPSQLQVGGDDDTIAQVVSGAGVVLAATADGPAGVPLADPPPEGRDAVTRTVPDLRGGEPYRVVSRWVDGADGRVVVHVAAPLDDVAESTGVLVRSLVVGVPAVAAVMAVLLWWLVGRTLRQVETIRADVAGIGGNELERRLPEPRGHDEVARLARTMNAMLDRIEEAARRQQRFVADASHELRSPLTRIRSEVEVDLAHPSTADPAATHRSVLEEVEGLQHLVGDLLHLARSDAGPPVDHRADPPVDLAEIAAREAANLDGLAGELAIDVRLDAGTFVRGDPVALARALRNLLENAARHARRTLSIGVEDEGGLVVLAVSDDGPGVPASEQDRIFERFARLDDARSPAGGGTGLGLAIARDVATRHGGTLVVDPHYRAGARFVLTLPAAGRPTGDPPSTIHTSGTR